MTYHQPATVLPRRGDAGDHPGAPCVDVTVPGVTARCFRPAELHWLASGYRADAERLERAAAGLSRRLAGVPDPLAEPLEEAPAAGSGAEAETPTEGDSV